ncbi:hypothetical protein [Glutamicibacter sp.]|uniref:hypothetical protein n=1 Tax=Glutamicibacter sp. TaxID=1931995 RepID=UPI002B4A9FA6|nr:hypothetical protein [Glutamicibacter sp.]HJX78140.1 hypothetical protein [Glutamicibacter sp.]
MALPNFIQPIANSRGEGNINGSLWNNQSIIDLEKSLKSAFRIAVVAFTSIFLAASSLVPAYSSAAHSASDSESEVSASVEPTAVPTPHSNQADETLDTQLGTSASTLSFPPIATAPILYVYSIGAMTVTDSGVTLKDGFGRNIPLTLTSGDGSGENFYSGTTLSGKKVNVHLVSSEPEAPLQDPESLWQPGDPIDEVPVNGEAHETEVEVTPTLLASSQMKPLLAIATTDDALSVATPAGVNVNQVLTYDSTLQVAQPASQISHTGGSITMSRADGNTALGVELEDENGTSNLTVPLATPAAAKKNNWTEIYYTTFIAPKYVNAKACRLTSIDHSTMYHNGNNRSWKNLSNGSAYESYKTVAGVKVDWARRKMYNIAKVGISKGYDQNYKFTRQKQASAKGIKFSKQKQTGTYANVEIKHAIGNPLCNVAGAISHTTNIKMYRSGLVKVISLRVRVPHHEVYARTNLKGSWSNLDRLSGTSFYCLTLPCGRQGMNKSRMLPIR